MHVWQVLKLNVMCNVMLRILFYSRLFMSMEMFLY